MAIMLSFFLTEVWNIIHCTKNCITNGACTVYFYSPNALRIDRYYTCLLFYGQKQWYWWAIAFEMILGGALHKLRHIFRGEAKRWRTLHKVMTTSLNKGEWVGVRAIFKKKMTLFMNRPLTGPRFLRATFEIQLPSVLEGSTYQDVIPYDF